MLCLGIEEQVGKQGMPRPVSAFDSNSVCDLRQVTSFLLNFSIWKIRSYLHQAILHKQCHDWWIWEVFWRCWGREGWSLQPAQLIGAGRKAWALLPHQHELQCHLQHGTRHPNAHVHFLASREPYGFHSQANSQVYELFSSALSITPATGWRMGEMLIHWWGWVRGILCTCTFKVQLL